MDKFLYILFLLLFQQVSAQRLYLKITSPTEFENKTIDSLSYQTKHENTKSVIDTFQRFQETLNEQGFINQRFLSHQKTNDSTFTYSLLLNTRIKSIKIQFDSLQPNIKSILNIDVSEKEIPFKDAQKLIDTYLQTLEKKGYSISELKLENHQIDDQMMSVQLKATLDKKRKIDLITINPYTNFPKGINHQLQKKYIKKDFNQKTILEIQKELSQFPFIKILKPAEVLFTENKTILYLYLEKAQSNQFDGLIGFTNDDNGKLKFNGNIDLKLRNILNKGEQFELYWKSDGNKQSTFNLGTELPYLFKSPIGLKANLQIFKQDSTQQNTKFNAALLYYITYNNKLGLGYQTTNSVAAELNTFKAANYSNQFVTLNYEFLVWKEHYLFPLQTQVNANLGMGKRTIEAANVDQQFVDIEAFHHFYLDNRNIVHLKTKIYQLFSSTVLYNELYRFGGIHSIRGFNENSLQAQALAGLFTEYRYLLSSSLYAHTILDYAYYSDKSFNSKGNLYSFGVGIGMVTPSGIFNLMYANGVQPNQDFSMKNSIIHVSFKTRF